MIVESRAVPPFMTNGYVLGCETTREAVVIDPGDAVTELIETATQQRLSVRYIMLTHSHLDHISGCNEAKAAFDAPLVLHRDDLFLYDRIVQQGIAFGFPMKAQPPIDLWFDGPGPWRFGTYEVFVHHTPGHSPGQVCLQVGPAGTKGPDLFVGDTLFAGSVGRTDLPGGNHDRLLASIRDVLVPLGDDCRVHPGHGPSTTIGEERRTNPFLQGTHG
jgi:hydroxyacylglutathione hydrolase